MQFLHTKLPLSTTTHRNNHQHLSSSHTITSTISLSNLSISLRNNRPPSTLIRMGGGPRTYPGGVSKWQWKRMQANKAKQLLKARLSRERHIYEMRKRAELMAAVSELERPWEVVKKAAPRSALFSVAADEQLKVLADRFQKPGGYDMWSENDGPQIFMTPDEGLPTARFFPKGVVHSIRPCGKVDHGKFEDSSRIESTDFAGPVSEGAAGTGKRRNGHRKRIGVTSRDEKKMVLDDANSQISISNVSDNGVNRSVRRGGHRGGGVSRMDGDRKRFGAEDERGRRSVDLRDVRRGSEGHNMSSQTRRDGKKWTGRGQNLVRGRDLNSEDVYDMSMQGDGTYGFNGSNQDDGVSSRVYEQKMIKSSFTK